MRDRLLMEVFPVGTKVQLNLIDVLGEIVTVSIKSTAVLYEVFYPVEKDYSTGWFQEFRFTAIGDKTCIWEKKHESN